MKNPHTPRAWAAGGCLALYAALGSAQPAPQAASQEGRWITESGNLEVDIAPCGPALCGTVVRVFANRSMGGSGQEMAAADPRPALGMVILSDLKASGDGEYKGTIYNRENAKSYSATTQVVGPDMLRVHAYVGLPLFGKTQIWRRPAPAQGASQ